MTENDGYEIAFKNGKEYMRQQIINKLLDAKGNAMGVQRMVISEIIDMIKKLVVRP